MIFVERRVCSGDRRDCGVKGFNHLVGLNVERGVRDQTAVRGELLPCCAANVIVAVEDDRDGFRKELEDLSGIRFVFRQTIHGSELRDDEGTDNGQERTCDNFRFGELFQRLF